METLNLPISIVNFDKLNELKKNINDCDKDVKVLEDKIKTILKQKKEYQKIMWNTCNHKWIRVGYGDDLDKYRCEYCNLSNLKNYYFR
tara:strand:- start:658 stop:921 length:264 start_codon:yes stop_codon:yes gene_type:complete